MKEHQTTMAQQIKPIQKRRKVLSAIHKNRIKIALLMFVTVIPLTLILTVYIGAYANNRKVHFDQTVTEQTTYVNKFVSKDDLDAIKVNISWYELSYPEVNDQGVLVGGEYKFDMSYEAKENYEIINVSITPVLKTPWTDLRSSIPSTPLLTTNKRVGISFNYELPVSPLWFVEVTEPNLYVKVDYTFMSAGNQVTKTAYILFSLKDLNPTRVTS